MPGMDGVELLRHLGSRHIRAGVVLFSGEDSRILRTAEDVARRHHLYVLGTLGKPVTARDLAQVLGSFDGERTSIGRQPVVPVTPAELRAGLAGDALELHFQPQVSVTTRAVVGAEALARWRHPERGLLPPPAFIPLAEETGDIDRLTDLVFARAMAVAGAWRASGLLLRMAVNFSVNSLARVDLPSLVVSRAEAEGVPASQITLEVTESGIARDLRASLEILARLRLHGVGLALDDFGQGYSTLEQLKRFPFTELKIDRAFVTGAAEDAAARVILESSIDLGRRLGLNLVAEGVETRQDWDLVASLGCREVQGYHVARPMPAEEIEAWTERWSAVGPPG
jgi:EAL domain-containing protein (putative c-di-GMP-specific phosphodiesterase class I)